VAAELARGVPGYSSLGSAAAGGWLKQVELQETARAGGIRQVQGRAWRWPGKKQRRSGSARWVTVNDGIAIIDEVVARTIGNRERLQVHGSLWLLIRSFKTRVLDGPRSRQS